MVIILHQDFFQYVKSLEAISFVIIWHFSEHAKGQLTHQGQYSINDLSKKSE